MSSDSSPPQSASDEGALWAALIDRRDVASRNRVVEYYLPLCRTIAATLYGKRGGLEVDFLDYMQFATLGLIEAVERFDPSLGFAFTTFATPRIRGAVLNNLEPLSEHYTQIRLRQRIAAQRLESLRATDPS
jgi:RNA polymerase sigma factor for flagellar operon FliA